MSGSYIEFQDVTWDQHEQMCEELCVHINDDCEYWPDAIIGLARGGVIPSRLFADYFDITLNFFSLDTSLYDDIGEPGEEVRIRSFNGDIKGKKILVVDDIWDTGRTMKAVLKYLDGEDVTTATLYRKEGSEGKPDHYLESVKEGVWVVFPWEKLETERWKSKRVRQLIGFSNALGKKNLSFSGE